MIITGGFNVYPKEIEDVICLNPAVAAAAVIGVPDAKWGEMVVAYIQLKQGCTLSGEAIISEVRLAKGPVSAPKRIEFLNELPLTSLGKIDKKNLRARHWTNLARAVN
jgi:fatty-acyl-CoA synthase